MSKLTEAMEATRARIQDLISFLAQPGRGFTEDQLAGIYLTVVGKPCGKPLDPTNQTTWDRLFKFGENGRKYFYRGQAKSKRSPITIHHISRIYEVMNLLFVLPNDAKFSREQSAWPAFLDKMLEAANSAKKTVPVAGTAGSETSENLRYIGNSIDGVEEFKKLAAGATFVYNTVFTRSEESFNYIREAIPLFQETMRALLNTNCIWNDIVMTKEMASVLECYLTLSDEQRTRYRASRLSTTLPLLQCLVLRYRDERMEALIGWAFSGSRETRVYHTNHKDTCEFFFDYCHKLFEAHPKLNFEKLQRTRERDAAEKGRTRRR